MPHQKFDALVLGVAHQEFLDLNFSHCKTPIVCCMMLKGFWGMDVDGRL